MQGFIDQLFKEKFQVTFNIVTERVEYNIRIIF